MQENLCILVGHEELFPHEWLLQQLSVTAAKELYPVLPGQHA